MGRTRRSRVILRRNMIPCPSSFNEIGIESRRFGTQALYRGVIFWSDVSGRWLRRIGLGTAENQEVPSRVDTVQPVGCSGFHITSSRSATSGMQPNHGTGQPFDFCFFVVARSLRRASEDTELRTYSLEYGSLLQTSGPRRHIWGRQDNAKTVKTD